MKCTNGMMKAGMKCSGINEIGESQLANPAKPLKPGVLNNVVDDFKRYGNETINRVVNYFFLVQSNTCVSGSINMCNFSSLKIFAKLGYLWIN